MEHQKKKIILGVVIVLLGGSTWFIVKTNRSGNRELQNSQNVNEKSVSDQGEETTSDALVAPDNAVSPELQPQTPVENNQKVPENPKMPEKQTTEKPKEVPKASLPFTIIDQLVSFGFQPANRKSQDIDTVVLHSSYNNQGGDEYSVEKVIDIWRDYGVAPHYVIDREGKVYRLVQEKNIAYHAGVSEMKDGWTDVNTFSIGVEILNSKDDQYTDAEYQAINDLIAYLKQTYPIKYVVGHDDIAPDRKTDPWNFDWKRLR